MINEIKGQALGSKISVDTEADISGGSTPYCGKQGIPKKKLIIER